MVSVHDLVANAQYTEKYVLQKLLCHYLICSREELWIYPDKEISQEIYDKVISGYVSATRDQKPLDYIIGQVQFFGHNFKVNEHTLVPRPETEYMVQGVSEYLAETPICGHQVLMDIGTGCGVLGVSVLLQNPGRFHEIFMTDISPDALEVAHKNRETHVPQEPVRFIVSDILLFVESIPLPSDTEIVLVANLPYIPDQAFDQNVPENVKAWEPRMAFVGGDDGLDRYRVMLNQIIEYKKGSKWKSITMFFEMMTWQMDILEREYGQKFVFEQIKTFHFNIIILKVVMRTEV